MLQRRTTIAAIAGFLLVAAVPALGADAPSPNDTARFLAGLPPAADSPLAPLTKDAGWQQHANAFNTSFGRVDQEQIAKIRTWSAAHLTESRPTMFYMFSGPDFLYANAFYPKAKTYVFAGLEPAGEVPDLTTLRGSLAPDLSHLRNSLRWIMQHSYFITSQMGSDLHRARFRGTLPVLLVFMARSNKTIREITRVKLDEDGKIQPDTDTARKLPARGVKIVFSGDDGQERTLYYFSTDLSNGGVANSKFLDFLDSLAPGDSLVKSASYLPHNPGFLKVREFLLNHSGAIVQDDTGPPLSAYDPQKWELQPYGKYVGPIAVFRGMYQAKYTALFKTAPAIDFSMGYQWRTNKSNVLLAIKKPGVSALEPAVGQITER